jgi:glucosamine--fructose-6-phosphate aminotransferase (isomerizing)
VLIDGLKALEYRGYDSAGVAAAADGGLVVVKKKGRVAELEKAVAPRGFFSRCGIGHTRWATHGEPSDENSHPHCGGSGRITVVHNGIIENYLALKRELADGGVKFRSETDTEVIAHLVQKYYEGDIHKAVTAALGRLRGSYAVAALCADFSDTVIAASYHSPLIVGLSSDGTYLASDTSALCDRADVLYRMSDGETAILRPTGAEFYLDGKPVVKKAIERSWQYGGAGLGGAESFMLKEINEIPRALKKTADYYDGGFFDSERAAKTFAGVRKIFITGCGTAYHAGMTGRALIERIARIPAETDLASEFRYRKPLLRRDSLCLFISQSGETADTLAVARLSAGAGVRTACITNVPGSALAALCDFTIPTLAGAEIAVASTKAYNCQLLALYRLAFHLAYMRKRLSKSFYKENLSVLSRIPSAASAITENAYRDILPLAEKYKNGRDIYFLGRGLDYYTALEGSLKVKEISYIHCEAFAAGELKHGALALIERGTPVIALLTQGELKEKTLNSLAEAKARGAEIIGVGKTEYIADAGVFDGRLTLPDTPDLFAPLVSVIPAQLLAYYTARARGCDADKPRNLAKSVTVE